MDDPGAVQRFADTWEGAWNSRDPDAVAALCAEDLAFDDPALGETVHGREPTPQGLFADVARRAILVGWYFTGTLEVDATTTTFSIRSAAPAHAEHAPSVEGCPLRRSRPFHHSSV